jgi:hypothetical protein
MRFFSYTAKDNPETAGVITRLLTTGSERAKQTIIPRIIDHVENYQEVRQEDAGEHLMHHALELWHTVETSREISHAFPLEDDIFIHTYTDTEKWSDLLTDWFWRGTIAFNVVMEFQSSSTLQGEMRSFVRYAGNHQNIGMVVKTAIDRQTLDTEIISYVLGGPASALNEGTL